MLGTPLLQLAKSLAVDAYRQVLSLPETEQLEPEVPPLTVALESLAAQSSALWQRVLLWVQGTLAGSHIDDPVVRVLAWSLMLWPMAACDGWACVAGKRWPAWPPRWPCWRWWSITPVRTSGRCGVSSASHCC